MRCGRIYTDFETIPGGGISTKPKIALVSNTSFFLYNFRLGLMRRLKELGYEVICVAPIDEYAGYLKREFAFYPIRNLDRKGKNLLRDFRLFLEFLSLYRKIKPSLVINFTIKPNIYSSIACGILGIPSISGISGLGHVFIKGGWLEKLVKTLYRISFVYNRYVIVVNSHDLDIIKGLTVQSKTVLVNGEGVNTEYFSPEFCREYKKEGEKTIFLFVGRFLKEKGVIELVEAGKILWQERKDFEIWLLGTLDYGNPQSLSQDEIDKISMYEFVKVLPFTKDVRPIICQADCVVLPSYYKEGIPKSLVEAMSMEKPIITTKNPGCVDVCEDGVNGFLVEPRDVGSLKTAMEIFLNLSDADRKNLGTAGREKVLRKFAEEIVISQYEVLIKKLLCPST